MRWILQLPKDKMYFFWYIFFAQEYVWKRSLIYTCIFCSDWWKDNPCLWFMNEHSHEFVYEQIKVFLVWWNVRGIKFQVIKIRVWEEHRISWSEYLYHISLKVTDYLDQIDNWSLSLYSGLKNVFNITIWTDNKRDTDHVNYMNIIMKTKCKRTISKLILNNNPLINEN